MPLHNLKPLANGADAEKVYMAQQWLASSGTRYPQLEALMAIDEMIVMGAQVDSELLKVSCRPPRGHWQRLYPNGMTQKDDWDGVKGVGNHECIRLDVINH